MKKIMFNDKYGLTQAVLNGTKTQTRRIITPQPYYDKNVGVVWKGYMNGRGLHDFGEPQASYRNFVHNSKYKVGEIVAVAQPYKALYPDADFEMIDDGFVTESAGWHNKMFVKADLMPHHIKITNVQVQRLQDITDEECLKEGIREVEKSNNWGNSATHTEYCVTYYNNKGLSKQIIGHSPKETYAFLIDALVGKGTWESNPFVWVYDFELFRYGEEKKE